MCRTVPPGQRYWQAAKKDSPRPASLPRMKSCSFPRCLEYDTIFLTAVVTTILSSLEKEDSTPMRFRFRQMRPRSFFGNKGEAAGGVQEQRCQGKVDAVLDLVCVWEW